MSLPLESIYYPTILTAENAHTKAARHIRRQGSWGVVEEKKRQQRQKNRHIFLFTQICPQNPAS